MKKKALISACLLGVNCRYDGKNNKLPDEKLEELKEKYELIPVCAEIYGGLTTPRVPSERRDGRVYSKVGVDIPHILLEIDTFKPRWANNQECLMIMTGECPPAYID